MRDMLMVPEFTCMGSLEDPDFVSLTVWPLGVVTASRTDK